jgi:hypothetical protein
MGGERIRTSAPLVPNRFWVKAKKRRVEDWHNDDSPIRSLWLNNFVFGTDNIPEHTLRCYTVERALRNGSIKEVER